MTSQLITDLIQDAAIIILAISIIIHSRGR